MDADFEMSTPDDDLEYPAIEKHGKLTSIRAFLVTHRLKVLVALILIITAIILLSAIAILIPLVITCPADNNDDNTPIIDNFHCGEIATSSNGLYIRTTAEYQILYNDLDKWTDREKNIKLWLATITNTSSYLKLSYAKGTSDIRYEYDLTTKGSDACNLASFIRVREYIQGQNANTTTIDIKNSAKNITDACNVPYWPSMPFVSNSSQKCEHDVHECNDKYARETRIILPTLSYADKSGIPCADLAKFYPYFFTQGKGYTNDAKKGSGRYWYLYSYLGTYTSTSEFEISFTLRYDSKDAAITQSSPPSYGEWSIRITAQDAGYSNTWLDSVVKDAENIWHTLITTYGNADC